MENHRKRKADQDDGPDSTSSVVSNDPRRPDPPSPAAVAPCSTALHAPRQPCLASDHTHPLWANGDDDARVSRPLAVQPCSQASAPKRPRLDLKLRIARKSSRRSPLKPSPTRSPSLRHGTDIEDIGIVQTVDPGPSSGSLLRSRAASAGDQSHPHRQGPPSAPLDLTTLPIPPPHPLINRQTLKELDLDAILRNPQLRHDLLFDPGLQFRPTGSKRKREMADRYWSSILQDIETGCTCMTFDFRRKPHRTRCICGETSTIAAPVQVTPELFTVRIPSRVPSLLTEFLEVLLLVIQPLTNISGLYVNPATFKAQMQEHSAQAAYIRSVFDAALIEQELRRDIFDPSDLFRVIGTTLKGHCAPMRDRSVEAMIRVAEQYGSSSSGPAARDAIKAFRMCMEILELMKLDIANHQLQTLRPFLLRTSGQFELRTLKGRYGPEFSLDTTREWIRSSHRAMLQTQAIRHPTFQGRLLEYPNLTANQQLYISILRGIVDLVFHPPATNPSSTTSPATTPPATPVAPSPSSTPFPSFPETLYLDNARLMLLSSDAADTTALYMLLLLFRQLVFSDESDSKGPRPKLIDADLIRIKRELRDIAGSYRLGRCFSRNQDENGKEVETSRVVKEDLVLQVAKRAKDAQSSRLTHPTPSSSSPSSLSSTAAPSIQSSSVSTSAIGEAPSERSLKIARRWADSHMREGSPLLTMFHNRLRDVVLNAVLASAFPGRDLASGCRPVVLNFSPSDTSNPGSAAVSATGMEPLSDEIRTLAEKISLVALIHLNAYLPMYENEGFAPSQ